LTSELEFHKPARITPRVFLFCYTNRMERFRYIDKENTGEIPRTPGVYAFKNAGVLLYIGKAGNLRDRVKTHFSQPSYRDNLFVEQVEKIGFVETNSEIEALLLESALIKELNPKYNVLWKDGKNYFFVAITGAEFPRVFLTHQPRLDKGEAVAEAKFGLAVGRGGGRSGSDRLPGVTYTGPFVDGGAIKRTLRILRGVFPYYTGSTSSRQAAKKHDKKPCQYCHLGLCPGPNPNRAEYAKAIKNLAAVLQGKRTSVMRNLEKEMREASKNQRYERAKDLRDQIQDLGIIFSHAKVFRPAAEKASIDWPAIEMYLQKILGISQRISRAEAYDISNIQGKEATGSMPVFIDGKPDKEHYRKFKVRISGKPNDFAMLQEVISRRLAHEEWTYPDLMIIDGGKGQLSAALQAVSKLQTPSSKFQANHKSQISRICVAAIAKKHNELFLPEKAKPLLLKDMPQSVSNFILHIRDEAHRFAISYHRLLRKKEMLRKR